MIVTIGMYVVSAKVRMNVVLGMRKTLRTVKGRV